MQNHCNKWHKRWTFGWCVHRGALFQQSEHVHGRRCIGYQTDAAKLPQKLSIFGCFSGENDQCWGSSVRNGTCQNILAESSVKLVGIQVCKSSLSHLVVQDGSVCFYELDIDTAGHITWHDIFPELGDHEHSSKGPHFSEHSDDSIHPTGHTLEQQRCDQAGLNLSVSIVSDGPKMWKDHRLGAWIDMPVLPNLADKM